MKGDTQREPKNSHCLWCFVTPNMMRHMVGVHNSSASSGLCLHCSLSPPHWVISPRNAPLQDLTPFEKSSDCVIYHDTKQQIKCYLLYPQKAAF